MNKKEHNFLKIPILGFSSSSDIENTGIYNMSGKELSIRELVSNMLTNSVLKVTNNFNTEIQYMTKFGGIEECIVWNEKGIIMKDLIENIPDDFFKGSFKKISKHPPFPDDVILASAIGIIIKD